MENWKAIPGFEGLYEVSDQGRVRNLERTVTVRGRSDGQTAKTIRERILRPGLSSGRPVVNLHADTKRRHALVHHLFLEAFVGPRPDGTECRHLDDNRQNNTLRNLEWGTRRENMADRKRNGLQRRAPRGEKNNASKLTESDVLTIRHLRAGGLTYLKIAQRMNVSLQTIGRIVKGDTWGWLDEGIDGPHLAMGPARRAHQV